MMEDVVVTGMGLVTALGADLDTFWQGLMAGRQAYRESPGEPPFPVVGRLTAFDPGDLGRADDEGYGLDRAAQLAVAAAGKALEHADLTLTVDNAAIPVIMGTTCGANYAIEAPGFDEAWFAEVGGDIACATLARYDHATLATAISRRFGLTGPASIIGTACAAGNHAVGEAADLIRLGRAEVVICGGAEALSQLPLYGFHSINGLADSECKPFDQERQGYVLGEGAGVMVLESAGHARARQARILARVVNWSLNCDASSFALPITDGSRCQELINDCLAACALRPQDIDYINLHGTGSKANDLMEVNGIKGAFGAQSRTTAVSSIKAMTGHTLGAAGILDNIATILAIQHNAIPPIINLVQAEEGFDLNFITTPHHAQRVDRALSLSFAFGGCNVATLFSRYEEVH